MSRRVCLSIGVSIITPRAGTASRFAYLDGAPLAAEAIGQWALSSGFGVDNVSVITDEPLPSRTPNPVTEERVRTAVKALFPENDTITNHLILSFCGHGLTSIDFGSTFWLFSDALEERYRVNVDEFISELLTLDVKRISLISDACRDAPKDLDLMRLEPRRGISGRLKRNRSPRFDRIAACQDGQRAYMVVEPGGAARGKCILSGVALDVLWGNEPEAFKNGIIDTHTFSVVTRKRAEERAAEYRLELNPQSSVDPEAAELVNSAAKPTPVIQLPPWPPAGKVESMGATAAERGFGFEGFESASDLELLNSNKDLRDAVLGRDFGTSHPDLDASVGFPGFPEGARKLVEELFALKRLKRDNDPRIAANIASTISALEGRAANHARAAAADTLRASLDRLHVPNQGYGANLFVTGGHVRNVWSESPVLGQFGRGHVQSILVESQRHEGAQVVIEFDEGEFAPVHVYPDLFAVVIRNPTGTIAIAYGGYNPEVLWESRQAITELTRGTLGASNVEGLAARIRHGKHVNPILGAIAAYLYRQISDFDNIARMAYYYVRHNQPVPFDIALLGQMEVYADRDRYFVNVPAVDRRERDPDLRDPLPDYALEETPAATGKLGGRCPWLTLGWDYPPGEFFRDKQYDHNRDIDQLYRPSSFTCLGRKLGEVLVDLWNLRRGR